MLDQSFHSGNPLILTDFLERELPQRQGWEYSVMNIVKQLETPVKVEKAHMFMSCPRVQKMSSQMQPIKPAMVICLTLISKKDFEEVKMLKPQEMFRISASFV